MKVIIFDTSILCVLLQIPGKETCGRKDDLWNKSRLDSFIKKEEGSRSTFVLPLASIIEVGNHIAQSSGNRYAMSGRLAEIIIKTSTNEEPWAAFSAQDQLWSSESINELALHWPTEAAKGIGIADYSIAKVANFYSKMGRAVTLLTGDEGLSQYSSVLNASIPRRRRC